VAVLSSIGGALALLAWRRPRLGGSLLLVGGIFLGVSVLFGSPT
jgi:hypothetical protein